MIALLAVVGSTVGAYFGARRAVSSRVATRPATPSSSGVSVSSSPETPDELTRRKLRKLAPVDNVRPYGL